MEKPAKPILKPNTRHRSPSVKRVRFAPDVKTSCGGNPVTKVASGSVARQPWTIFKHGRSSFFTSVWICAFFLLLILAAFAVVYAQAPVERKHI